MKQLPLIIIISFSILLLIILIFKKKLKKYVNKTKNTQPVLAIHSVFLPKENILFLEEWIEYHLNLGFDKIYLYNNDGSIHIKNISLNKYDINFEKIIGNIDYSLEKIQKKYKNKVFIVRWDYRNNNNEIIYGQGESIVDYIKKYKNKSDWTAFIDIDEFIFINPKYKSLKNYIKEKEKSNITKLIIKQKKFSDRFCNLDKLVINIDDCIDINTDGWAYKNMCKTNQVSTDLKSHHIHNITMVNDKSYVCDINELRFNHYNVNIKQINWMKGFFNQDKFISSKDNSMNIYNNPSYSKYLKKRKYNKEYYLENKNKFCYNF